MYKYFEPDTVAVLDELVALAKPMDKPAPKGDKAPQMQKVRLDRNQRQQNVYYKEYNVYQNKNKDWDEFNRIDAKLREQILTTVVLQKKAILQRIYTAQKWLTDL